MIELTNRRRRRTKLYELQPGKLRAVCSLENLHVPEDFSAWTQIRQTSGEKVAGSQVPWLDLDRGITLDNGTLTLNRGWFGLRVPAGEIGYRYVSRLTGGEVRVRLVAVDGAPVTVPTPRIDGHEVWWDISPALSMFLRVQSGKLEIFKKLFNASAPATFDWEVIETLPAGINVRIDTAGHDNADLLDSAREGTGVGRRRRNLRMRSTVTSDTNPQPDLRRRVIRERWQNKQTVALDANRVPSFSNEVSYPVLIDQDITEDIAAVGDDGHQISGVDTWQAQYGATGNHIIYRTGADVDWFPGYRFAAVVIDQGVTIDSATLTINFASSSGSNAGTGGTLFGNDVDDAPAWANGAGPRNMTPTTASVAFPDFGNGAGTGNKAMTVTAIVQEIVDRASWASGNDMAFGVQGNLTAAGLSYSYIDDLNGGATNVARLTIDFTAGGGGTILPIVNAMMMG